MSVTESHLDVRAVGLRAGLDLPLRELDVVHAPAGGCVLGGGVEAAEDGEDEVAGLGALWLARAPALHDLWRGIGGEGEVDGRGVGHCTVVRGVRRVRRVRRVRGVRRVRDVRQSEVDWQVEKDLGSPLYIVFAWCPTVKL